MDAAPHGTIKSRVDPPLTWTILTEEEEYLQSLEKRLAAVKSGKVRPRGQPLKQNPFESDFDAGDMNIAAAEYQPYAPRYTESDGMLADIREDLEYDPETRLFKDDPTGEASPANAPSVDSESSCCSCTIS